MISYVSFSTQLCVKFETILRVKEAKKQAEEGLEILESKLGERYLKEGESIKSRVRATSAKHKVEGYLLVLLNRFHRSYL